MKRFIFSLIMVIGLSFSNVGYANPDVNTKKAVDIEVLQADVQVEMHGIYEVVKTNAPEVFSGKRTSTRVYLFGDKKAEAFKYLVKDRNGVGIFIGKDKECYKTEILAVEICKPDKIGLRNYDKNKLNFK